MIKLYSASQIAKELHMTRDNVHKLLKKKEIPQPLYETNGVMGWTESQVNEIKERINNRRGK